ncbi:MAG: hypothetical protein LBK73_12670 [Treponema sp.]|jgi:hypothetical protein|nr:hypothetical protein [Treponema sp.]
MKTRRVFLIFVFSSVSYVVFPAPPPVWYRDKTAEYPDSRFIAEIGMGDTLDAAKTMALSNIAMFFKTSIRAQNELFTEYNESVSGKGKQTNRNSLMRNQAVITSEAEFLGVRFASPWYNEQSGTWVALGYIDIEEALQIYRNRIETNHNSLIQRLLTAYEQEEELLYKVEYLRGAVATAKIIEEDIRALSILNSSGQFAEVLAHTREAVAAYNAYRTKITFGVHIDGDRDGLIGRKLFSILESAGYICDPRNAAYIIHGDITTSEETLPAGYFVRASITLQLFGGNGAVLYSYSKNYSRKGAKSWEAAYGSAFKGIADDLSRNFINEFSALYGRLN